MLSSCPDLELINDFYDADNSVRLYQRLWQEQNWPDNRYIVGGREFILPRLQTWHADPGIRYSYSNNLLLTQPWTSLLAEIKNQVELYLQYYFNAVLVNLYRDGNDYVGWHADNEPELGKQPLIASITFGAARHLQFRHKKSSAYGQLLLPSGSLLIMRPNFQHDWLHRLPIAENICAGRINLTFRKVMPEKL